MNHPVHLKPNHTLKFFLVISAACCASNLAATAQTTPVLYPQLSKTLDSLAYVDQWPMQRLMQQQPDSAGRSLFDVEKENYARHQPMLEKIVRQVGYPGFRQVGEKSSGNFWLLVQHADAHPDFQRRVLKLMLPEVKKKNASSSNYAYLTDRVAVNNGKPEEYGTQVEYRGLGLGKAVPKSLRNPSSVDKRRVAIGMEPLQNYLDMMTKMHVENEHAEEVNLFMDNDGKQGYLQFENEELRNILRERSENLFEALSALSSMWNQYCPPPRTHLNMSAGEEAEEILQKWQLMRADESSVYISGLVVDDDIPQKVLDLLGVPPLLTDL